MQSLYVSVFSAEMGASLCCCDRNRIHQDPSTSVIRAADSPPSIGKILVFVNPNSGAGKGIPTFYSKVASQLKKNNIQYELVITNGVNHARNFVSSRENILEFNGIMIISGDGLVYEVLNGLCDRPDAGKVVPQMPIAVIPTGSGNGLLSSLFASKGWSLKQPIFTNQACLIATAPQSVAQPINLLHVQTKKENIASFLSVGWGLMADIDIESEKYRKTLGSNRFTVSALVRCMNLRTYRGRLSYKPYTSIGSTTSSPFSVYQSRKNEELPDNPSSSTGDGISTRNGDDFWNTRQLISAPQLDQEIPSDWIVVEDEFVGVYAMALSHLAADGHFMPGAKLDDDKIYLSYVLKKDIKSKSQLVKMLLSIEKGKHVELSYFKKVEVSCFRLEPQDPESLLVIDGEVIDAVQLQVTATDLKTAIFT